MAAGLLEQVVVLQSKTAEGKYLRYLPEEEEEYENLEFSEKEIVSPFAKFEIQASKTDNKLVHIRSCYNKKYFVAKSRYWTVEVDYDDGGLFEERLYPMHTSVQKSSFWIVAQADKPEEDRSKSSSCTLFEPEILGSSSPASAAANAATRIRLRHVGLGKYASSSTTGSLIYLVPPNVAEDERDVFTAINLKFLVILPKYVAFKGDNDLYLRACWYRGHEYQEFSAKDVADEGTLHEVFTNPDGTVRIKSRYWDRFWRRCPNAQLIPFTTNLDPTDVSCRGNWIWADSTDDYTDDKDTLFQPVELDHNTIALRNMGNSKWCARLKADCSTKDFLNANSDDKNQWTKLKVEDAVFLTDVYNVKYGLKDANVYDEDVVDDMFTDFNTNKTQHEIPKELKVKHKESTVKTWDNSESVKWGGKITFVAGDPDILSTGFELSAQRATERAWGEKEEETVEIEMTYTVVVPPMKKVIAQVVGKKSNYDIPFSYTQRQVLFDGRTVTTRKHDGIYRGSNMYKKEIKIVFEDITHP